MSEYRASTEHRDAFRQIIALYEKPLRRQLGPSQVGRMGIDWRATMKEAKEIARGALFVCDVHD